MSRRYRNVTRRSVKWEVVPTQQTVTLPVIPSYLRAARRPLVLPRRRGAALTSPPMVAPTVGTYTRRSRNVPLRPRRGFITPVVFPGTNTGTQVPAPAMLVPTRRQNNPQPIHRRMLVTPVPAPVNNASAPPVPSYIDPARRQNNPQPIHRRMLVTPVPAPINTGQAPVVPVYVRNTRRVVTLQRRGQLFAPVAPAVATVITPPIGNIVRRRTALGPGRRARLTNFVPAQINTGTQQLPPSLMRRAGDSTPRFLRTRRGTFYAYPVLVTAPGPNPTPVPPTQGGGAFSPSLGRRFWRSKRRAIMNRQSRVFR